MSNYLPVQYDDAPEDLKALYDEIMTSLKLDALPNWVVYLGQAPHLARGMWEVLKSVRDRREDQVNIF